jgi:diguanylate cyclase (GGDEF)-like protein
MKHPAQKGPAAKLKQENQQLKELLQAARLVFSTLELNTAIDAILKTAQELTHAKVTSIALLNEKTGELYIHTHRGFDKNLIGTARWKPRKGSFMEKLLRSKKSLVVKNQVPQGLFKERYRKNQKVKTVACVPLVFKGNVLGILFADDFNPRDFSPAEQRALKVLSAFAANAIDHAKLHRLTQELARTDGLTDLYNYRYFHERLEDEIQRAKRYHRILSLIMLDVDNFKHFNDTYGHSVGDMVLKKIAAIIKHSMRDVDLASRYGGEEFTVLLPETDTIHALAVAERIRRNIEKLTPGSLGIRGKEGAHASLGLACYPWDAQDKDDLIRRADEAMYTAKAQGKNRVVSSGRSLVV